MFTKVPHPKRCLARDSPQLSSFGSYNSSMRFLHYPDGRLVNISLPYASWASARILSEIAYIMLAEVMGYAVDLWDGAGINSGQPINYASGCRDPDDAACKGGDIDNPLIHCTIETWSLGMRRVYDLPAQVQPTLVSVLNYETVNQIFVWKSTVDQGAAKDLALDYYRYYNAKYYDPSGYFDSLEQLLDKVPVDYIERCSDQDTGTYNNFRDTANYITQTGNTQVDCVDDKVWLSPACRLLGNVSRCIPMVTQYEVHVHMQLAFFLNFSIAIVKMRDGSPEFDQKYYEVVRGGNYFFGWYTPDDNLRGLGSKVPVMLRLPDTNQLEHNMRIYKTGLAHVNPRSYCWKKLQTVDRHVSFLATRMNFFDQEMNDLMDASGKTRGSGLSVYEAMWNVACSWVLANPDRWKAWIPAICPAGQAADVTLGKCEQCSPGFFCEGGTNPAFPCPKNCFCPAGSSMPLPCPSPLLTDGQGRSQLQECNHCPPEMVMVNGGCIRLSVLLVSIVIPVLALCLLLLKCWRIVRVWMAAPEEKLLEQSVSDLRKRLSIERKDGFYLTNERLLPWVDRQSVVIIPKESLEAAGRLALFQDDVDDYFLSSFCLGLTTSRKVQERRDEAREQYEKFCHWLLGICRALLQASPSSSFPSGWSKKGLLRRVSPHAATRKWSTVVSAAEAKATDERYQRHAYFKRKVAILNVWREDPNLFDRLRSLAMELMDESAHDCEERCKQLYEEESMQVLLGLQDMHHGQQQDDEIGGQQPYASEDDGELRSDVARDRQKDMGLLRQDDDDVRAIRIDDGERVNAQFLFQRMRRSGNLHCLDEGVFITQLRARAQLLNLSFHRAVIDVLSLHCSSPFSISSSATLRGSRVILNCDFEEGAGEVQIHLARPKTCSRMAEKLREYAPPNRKSRWPLTANILDPVRLSVVCHGTSQIVQVARWFMEQEGRFGVRVRRVKNRFREEEVEHGYRDLKLYVSYCSEEDVSIIGEIQVQDALLYRQYVQMHRLYKIKRAQSMHFYLHQTSW
ncbi:hypothetical protein GUITHDRAFT_112545 [Guillardia theta CCMP2712]|uniref:Uncharacterized protein n=1 Tax=Guillardia theta (strain CCMP2712) TaxID=905079 RepID=L1IZM0_GUITC|nr:hypothetical protein GUITHDRAFT_112545 [Guillardia theta CCMP2712]EKX41334.1 hypothetical protein GUITHDRAFT_112545 [Guillardia theta CCMP2712]|eukprot:XP_005828314.1 hypothetical protein GUITHDRAFT_112545 [Guillardia theta CCMP2712]